MSKQIAWPKPQNNPYERPFLTGGSASAQTATVNVNRWWPSTPAATFVYQWVRNSAAVSSTVANATSASYGIASIDRGSTIACTVTATNVNGQRVVGCAAGFTIA
jgi:hypothetical protein